VIPHCLESLDWRTGLDVLSLDFARPVYHDLGLPIGCEETLKGLARDALTGRLGEETILSARPLGDSADYHSIHAVPFLECTSRIFGPSGRRRVEYWVAYTVCTENHNPWVLYNDVLSTWAAIYRTTNRDEIGFSADPATVAREVKAASDLSVPEAILRKQRQTVLTDWDLSLFSKLGLLEIPEGSDFFPLVDAIELMIAMHRFQTFWPWLLSFIGREDLAAIGSFAKIRARKRDMPYVSPEALPILIP
jgi:hypothetical protein